MHSVCHQYARPGSLSSRSSGNLTPCVHGLCARRPLSRLPTRGRSVTRLARAYSRYEPGASTRNSYSPPIQRNLNSAVHSVSFNQQLLIVLAIPAAALGIPFALGHPILCIIIPLIVFYNPRLQEVVKPLLTALLQFVLSGLRPAGSPKSAAFPWQQASRSTWSSPPIDIDYQALPGESEFSAAPPTQTASRSRDQYDQSYEPSTSFPSEPRNSTSRSRVTISRPDSMGMQEDSAYRRKVSIKPAPSTAARQDRIVRHAAPGQVGVNLRPDSYISSPSNSNIVRVLIGVFPFLRHWGGFV